MGEVKPNAETFAKIKVVGVGGSGGNAVNRMVEKGIKGVEFVAINTDVQALHYNKANEKIHIGKTVTKGLGAGMNPELGKASAEEAQNEIRDVLKDSDMVFITCGLGGGTGTGASPMVAEIAKDLGALTVGVITRPFAFEGGQRKKIGERGFSELADKVDTIITISNDKLLQVIEKDTSLLEAFIVADDILRQGVQGIAEVITMPGIVNADFADVRTVMNSAGSALMGIGESGGENRAVEAAKAAISSPLLDMSIEGAQGVVFTISGGPSLSMNEVNEAAKIITASADEEATVIFGAVIDENLKDEVKITVIATGFDNNNKPSEKTEGVYTPSNFIEEEQKKDLMSSSSEENTSSHNKETWKEADKSDKSKEKEEKKLNKKKNDRVFSSVEEAQSQPAAEEKKNDEEEDDELSVPAFIRKKMK